MRVSTRLVHSAVVVVLMFTLTGCTPASPIYLKVIEGDLAIKVCENLHVQRISVGAVTETSSQQGDVIWQAFGDADIREGDEVMVGILPSGFDQVAVEYRGLPSELKALTASLQLVDARENPISGPAGSFDSSLLREDGWLSADGRVVSNPC